MDVSLNKLPVVAAPPPATLQPSALRAPDGVVRLIARDGKVFASSRDVAKIFDKEHGHVLRDIDALLGHPNLDDQQKQGVTLFKQMASFDERANKNVRFFEMTRDPALGSNFGPFKIEDLTGETTSHYSA